MPGLCWLLVKVVALYARTHTQQAHTADIVHTAKAALDINTACRSITMGASMSELATTVPPGDLENLTPRYVSWPSTAGYILYWIIFGIMAGSLVLFSLMTFRHPQQDRKHGCKHVLVASTAQMPSSLPGLLHCYQQSSTIVCANDTMHALQQHVATTGRHNILTC